ncbi:hypothetical protein HID58_001848, partial [Brassica napus]
IQTGTFNFMGQRDGVKSHIYQKNQIVIIPSIILRLHEGKLSLITTPGSRFYFDNDIDIIQRFQKRNKLLS